INNATDSVSSVISLIGFNLAKKPADEDHPYGHARFEYVSGFVISVAIIFVGYELVKSSIEKIISSQAVVFSIITVAVLAISILVKIILYFYNITVSKKINSTSLKTTAMDCRNDAIITAAVLIAIVIEKFTSVSIDGYMGLLVAIFILINGIKLVKETVTPLLGGKCDSRLRDIILSKLPDYPIVIGYHDLMIHDYGPGVSFCSIHFEIDKNLDPLYVHELIDKFEREMLAYGTSLTVHYDPVETDSPELNLLKHAVVGLLVELDNRLSIHDFRSIPCDGFTKVFFDVAVPIDFKIEKDKLKQLVEEKINSLNDTIYQAEITLDSVVFN
ncbi:MAG: cation transporter, partial [Clostridia bacterium]|nr:cation transporter [Clostridia bacterium]